jgi:hypothetical protein
MNEIKRIVSIFFFPKNTFLEIKENPRWIIPFSIYIVILAITIIFTFLITREDVISIQKKLLEDKGMNHEQIEKTISLMYTPFPILIGIISSIIVFSCLLLVFSGAITLLVIFWGRKVSFSHLFSVICYSNLVKIIAHIVKWIVIGFTKSFPVTSFALFTPFLKKNSLLLKFLSKADFFTLWEMVLISLGLSITNNLKKSSSYFIVFFLWILSIIVQILGELILGLG